MTNEGVVFKTLNADDPEVTEIESLCVNCGANGVTRLLLTKIPFYKDVIVMSFSCDHCNFQNNEIQSGAQIAEKGVRYLLKVETPRDLNRQVVKSDYASVKIVEVDFEIPPKSQNGEITTVEGIITRAINGLEQDQETRRKEHSDVAAQIDEFIKKLNLLKEFQEPFTLILEDISGNSFIENPNAPQKDPNCSVHYFVRTIEQNHELGIYTKEEVGVSNDDGILHPIAENEGQNILTDLEGEVFGFNTNCPACNAPCQTNMKVTNIPHFKEVVIMATTCDACGTRTNEVKSGGGIEPLGIRIEVEVNGKEDFSRDLLKSETCSLSIPQLDLEVGPYALGGRFTTVEGILVAVKEQLSDPSYSHMFGDSEDPERKKRLEKFMEVYNTILEGKSKVTVVLDDPAGNSYIQSLSDDDNPDDRLRITRYERSFEQNEELGLNDMKTENYES